jgi:hypothetical protein
MPELPRLLHDFLRPADTDAVVTVARAAAGAAAHQPAAARLMYGGRGICPGLVVMQFFVRMRLFFGGVAAAPYN